MLCYVILAVGVVATVVAVVASAALTAVAVAVVAVLVVDLTVADWIVVRREARRFAQGHGYGEPGRSNDDGSGHANPRPSKESAQYMLSERSCRQCA